jgi:hypothetical protein
MATATALDTCTASCMTATSHVSKCECSGCYGHNHGMLNSIAEMLAPSTSTAPVGSRQRIMDEESF